MIILAMFVNLVACKTEAPKEAGDENQVGQGEQEAGETAEVPPPDQMILSAGEWKDKFPKIYETYLLTATFKDGLNENPELGGSYPPSYLERYPDIKVLYDGIGFAKEYYMARGHHYALHDVINTARPKPGASCLACKTADYERLLAEHKDNLHAMDFHKVSQEAENGVTCYTCHRNDPGKQVVATTHHFNQAKNKLEKELKPGTLACAQCHVEYYMDLETQEVILPWDKGLEIEDIEAYYDERDYYDWKHPRTGTPLLKMQHPEFETYTGSLHDKMGVTCADCHMPTIEEDGQKFTSHWAKSPLKDIEASCSKCHGSEIDTLNTRVENIQKEIDSELLEISKMLVELIENFGKALEDNKLDEATINELWDLHRKAQFRWDFIFVENSTGFHNTSKARKALGEAKDFAQQALDKLAEFK